MRRPQFSLKTLLWLMVVVAAFFGGWFAGCEFQRRAEIARRIMNNEGIEITIDGRRVFIPFAKQTLENPGWRSFEPPDAPDKQVAPN